MSIEFRTLELFKNHFEWEVFLVNKFKDHLDGQ